MTSPTTSAAPASKSPPMNLRGSRPCILLCMILTLTVTISLDDSNDDGLQDAIDALRTTVSHEAGQLLAKFDPAVSDPTVTYTS